MGRAQGRDRCARLAQGRAVAREPGDWRVDRPHFKGGGWAFQFANDYYPDLDDTAVVAWAMHQAPNAANTRESVSRALDWLAGMQSKNGGFAAFDADNTSYYLNKIPFADHGALLDPPTSDVTRAGRDGARRSIGRPQDGRRSSARSPICVPSRRRTARGSGGGARTTSMAPGRCSRRSRRRACPRRIRRCARGGLAAHAAECGWRMGREQRQLLEGAVAAAEWPSTPYQTAWALLGLLAAGEAHSMRCAPR